MPRFYSFFFISWLLALLPRLAAATNPTLVIQGVGSGTTDVTAFLDQVQILDANDNVVAGAVGDASFEAVATTAYAYQPSGSAWTFVGDGSGATPGAGLTANGSAFAPPAAPDGTQAAFVQRMGYLRQVLTLGAGTYRVRFLMAQRGSNSVAQQLDVQVLGVRVGTASLGSSSAYAQFTSDTFTVTSGPPTITGFSYSQVGAGTLVTVTGTNLSGTSQVTANGVAATNVLVQTNQRLTFTAPAGISAIRQVTLTTPDGTASYTDFTSALLSSNPAANTSRAVRAGSPLTLSFNDAIAAGTIGQVAVYSAQAGGRKAGQWTGGGTLTLRYRSTLPGRRGDFQPGELVSVTVPASVQTTSGQMVAKKVFQFRAGVGNAGTGSFGGGSDPAAGDAAQQLYPYNVVLGDIDGDGDLDMLVANIYSGSGTPTPGTVSVRLNDGLGNFTAPAGSRAELSVGTRRFDANLALGDVDGDGDLDLLTTNNLSGTVSLRLNDGTGGFAAPAAPYAEVSVSGRPVSVTLGDLDADGDLDMLALSPSYGNSDPGLGRLSVRLNDGTGRFTAPATNADIDTGERTNSKRLALGDVDGDGDLDVVLPRYEANTSLLLRNNGQGNFGTLSTATDIQVSGSDDIVLADADGDGDLDLLTKVTNEIGVFTNDGTGSFTSSSSITTTNFPAPYGSGMVVGDVNGDGNLDVLVPLQAGFEQRSGTEILLGDGVGNFTHPASNSVISGGIRGGVFAGDVDGDGDLDVAAVNYNDKTVSVRLNGGTGLVVTSVAPAPAAIAAPAGSVVQATFNQPLASSATAGLRVFSAQRGGLRSRGGAGVSVSGNTLTYTPPAAQPYLPGETILSVVTSSAVASSGAPLGRPQVQQFTVATGGRGRGNFVAPATGASVGVGGNPRRTVLGDVNNDGSPDLLTANGSTVSVRLGNGQGAFTPPATNAEITVGAIGLALGDVNNDGNLDLLTVNSGTVYVRLGDGTGSFTPPATTATAGPDVAVGSGAQRLALGDVDGDGNLDVLTANPSNGTVSVRLGTGQGYFAAPATGAEVAAGTSPNDLALGDIDSDGDLDLMVAHTNFNMDFDADPTLKIRLNDGAGHFAPPATGADVLAGQVARGLALGDIDGDGDLDAVAASGDELSVRLNDGTGRFTAPATGAQVPTSLNNAQVVLGDVDADGDLDVLTVNRRSSSAISVRLNDGLGHFAPPAANAELLIGNGDTLTLMLGDVDSDGDLDLLVPIGITVAVRLNQPAAPALTVASPAAAGVGIPVTFTGMDLDGATGVTVGGTAATITARSATSLTFVVPAGVVPGTFPVVVTTPGGAASLSYTILAAPGNALAFDGSGDYVRLPAGTVAALQNDFTLEYWVRTTQAGTGSSGGQWWEGTGLLDGEVNGPAADYGTSLLAGRVAFGVGGGTGQFATIKDVTIQSTTLVNDGRWHYVVATRRASDGLMTLYIDGQPQATDIGSRSARSAPPQLTLGVLQSTAASGSNFFQGSLDEVRLWSQVRSASDIAAAYLAGPQANLSQSGLVAYYSFDEGLPGGTNADAATLYDLTPSALAGTLTGFALASGTTSSNFVASYALVVPTATAATSKTVSGFTANWTASAVGTLDSYLLDVSTAADFSAPVAGSPFAVAASARSKALTGLSNGTSYYYRLRAELSSLTGQGAPSNVVGVSAPLPVTLVAFTAERLEADGLLRWATASELNNAYYQIESSVDGVAFQPLGRVAGAGTSTQAHSYQFVDKSLARYGAPRVYYRLRQVDADGTSAYSPVQALAVPLAAGLAVQAYPNPSARADEVTLAIGTDQAGPVALVLVNALGQQISQQQLMLPAGASTVPLAGASQLPAGVYLLRVRQGAQQQVLKLVRQ